MGKRVVVVGAGITGLTAAYTIASRDKDADVSVLEANSRFGGNIRTTPFAGLPAVDEGPDAFLVRIPFAMQLATEIGFTDADLTSPATGSAYVWHNKMHPIPAGLMLGVPGEIMPIAKSGLLSPLGKLRAGIEPLLPQTNSGDSIGRLIRRRFGDEVHERLVDPLIGSIYASDTDHISIKSVPQLDALANGNRSLLLAVRKQKKSMPVAAGSPVAIFATPRNGIGALVDALVAKCSALGVTLANDAAVNSIDPGYKVHTAHRTYEADSVIVASPAQISAPILHGISTEVAETLATWEHVGVVIATLQVPQSEFPSEFQGSGYLVPKSDQNKVTAVSFASNKWAHLQPSDGSRIMRVSIGQDGNPVGDMDNDEILSTVLGDLKRHMKVSFNPSAVRISRWDNAFPQYRPGHFDRVDAIERTLATAAPGVFLAGASHRGIGIPACVQQARTAAEKAIVHIAGKA